MDGVKGGGRNGKTIVCRKITDMPEAAFLNGLTTLPTQDHTVLIGDSINGVVYFLNADSGEYGVVLDEEAFKPNASGAVFLGLNGIHVFHESLYFTNSFQAPFLARIPLARDGSATGPLEVLIEDPPFPVNIGFNGDDFAIDEKGVVWMTTDPSNMLLKIADSDVRVIAGGLRDPAVAGITAAAFGRGRRDGEKSYMSSNGGLADPKSTDRAGRTIPKREIVTFKARRTTAMMQTARWSRRRSISTQLRTSILVRVFRGLLRFFEVRPNSACLYWDTTRFYHKYALRQAPIIVAYQLALRRTNSQLALR